MKNDKVLHAILYSPGVAHSIKTAVSLGIFDELCNGPITAKKLAIKKKLNVDALKRFLNFLANLGLIDEMPSFEYALTESGERFASTSINSMLRESLLLLSQEIEMSWSDLHYSLKTGKPAFDNVFGVNFKDYLDMKRGRSLVFHAGWEEITEKVGTELLSIFSFKRVSSIAELGGRDGTLLSKILMLNPQLTGYLYETSTLKGKIKKKFSDCNISHRAHFIEASFPTPLAVKSEIIILKSFLHLFNNDNVREILGFCLKGLLHNGRILVLERELSHGGFLDRAVFTDMIMLLLTGGRERTSDEMESVFNQSGFTLQKVHKLDSGFCVFEGVPS